MEHEEFNFPVSGIHRPFPKLKQVAMISLCSWILKNPDHQILFEHLPDLLKKECLVMNQRMRSNLQMDQYQCRNYTLLSGYNVVWTHFGTVDMVETFHSNKQLLPPKERFQMACYLCLEDEILAIWDKEGLKYVDWRTDVYLEKQIFEYWLKFCRKNSPGPRDIFDIFKECMLHHYFYPLLYFWTKLTTAERNEVLDVFINMRFGSLEEKLVYTAETAVFFLNKMNETQKKYFLRTQPIRLLTNLSQFYYVCDFIKIVRYFLVNKSITLPNAFEFCLDFYIELSNDFYIYEMYKKPLDYPFERVKLYRESVILVLQDSSCPRNDMINMYRLLSEHYKNRLGVRSFFQFKQEITQIVIINNVVARIVRDFAECIDSLESSYKQALENKTSDAYRVFMKKFVRSYSILFCENH